VPSGDGHRDIDEPGVEIGGTVACACTAADEASSESLVQCALPHRRRHLLAGGWL